MLWGQCNERAPSYLGIKRILGKEQGLFLLGPKGIHVLSGPQHTWSSIGKRGLEDKDLSSAVLQTKAGAPNGGAEAVFAHNSVLEGDWDLRQQVLYDFPKRGTIISVTLPPLPQKKGNEGLTWSTRD